MEKLKRWINDFEANACSILLFVMLIILFMQVVLRYVFNAPTAWSDELARYLFIWFAYLAASMCALSNTHIRIDILAKVWPKIIRPYIFFVGNLIFFLFCVFTTYYGWLFTESLIQAGQVSLGLGIQMWVVFAALPVCNLLMMIRLIQSTIRVVKDGSYKDV